ncbi:MAG: hypothetical protein AAF191_18965 [Verrucomicrobiota bacterium]
MKIDLSELSIELTDYPQPTKAQLRAYLADLRSGDEIEVWFAEDQLGFAKTPEGLVRYAESCSLTNLESSLKEIDRKLEKTVWMMEASDKGEKVHLFTIVSDETYLNDLRLGSNSVVSGPVQNAPIYAHHKNAAFGAMDHYCRNRDFGHDGKPRRCSEKDLPTGDATTHIGGVQKSLLFPIWEHRRQ